jgi:hypothetical protein
MSRITGTDAANLIEAYNAVYVSNEEVELTEEQVQEDFENWVNSLVEEGHDLSEYTWEDMYEAYLDEIIRPTTGQMTADRRAAQSPKPTPTPAPYRPGGGRQEYNQRRSGTGQMPPPATPRTSAEPYQSRFAGARDAAFARARQIQGSPVVGPRTAAPTPTVPARPAATAPARPAVQSQKPTTTPAPVRTPNPLMQATFGYQTGQAPSQIAATRAATTTAANNLSGTGALAVRPATTTPAASAPKPNTQQQIRQRRLNMDLDLFDIVQGYLLDEGYAETEEAAAVIMANMSEEWKQSIVEAYGSFGANMAGAELQRRQTEKVRQQEREKIEQEKKGGSGASSQVKGA